MLEVDPTNPWKHFALLSFTSFLTTLVTLLLCLLSWNQIKLSSKHPYLRRDIKTLTSSFSWFDTLISKLATIEPCTCTHQRTRAYPGASHTWQNLGIKLRDCWGVWVWNHTTLLEHFSTPSRMTATWTTWPCPVGKEHWRKSFLDPHLLRKPPPP
jgi:hypothetical protein